jgi:hypothetical protein
MTLNTVAERIHCDDAGVNDKNTVNTNLSNNPRGSKLVDVGIGHNKCKTA